MSVKAPRGLTHARRLRPPNSGWSGSPGPGTSCGIAAGPSWCSCILTPNATTPGWTTSCVVCPSGLRVAVEFRHPSWDDPAVYDLLERRDASYVVMSGAGLPCVLRATAQLVYVRLHGPDPRRCTRGPTPPMTWTGGRTASTSGISRAETCWPTSTMTAPGTRSATPGRCARCSGMPSTAAASDHTSSRSTRRIPPPLVLLCESASRRALGHRWRSARTPADSCGPAAVEHLAGRLHCVVRDFGRGPRVCRPPSKASLNVGVALRQFHGSPSMMAYAAIRSPAEYAKCIGPMTRTEGFHTRGCVRFPDYAKIVVLVLVATAAWFVASPAPSTPAGPAGPVPSTPMSDARRPAAAAPYPRQQHTSDCGRCRWPTRSARSPAANPPNSTPLSWPKQPRAQWGAARSGTSGDTDIRILPVLFWHYRIKADNIHTITERWSMIWPNGARSS